MTKPPQTHTVPKQARSRGQFEREMEAANWQAIHNRAGRIIDWQHRITRYRQDDRSCFDFFKLAGYTPMPY